MITANLTWPVNPSTGKLEGGYLPMPPQFQLSANRYSAAKYDFVGVYPDRDSVTSQYSYHRLGQVGEPMRIPIAGMWGAYPYGFSEISMPPGSSMGVWLGTDANGDLVADDQYALFTWPSPTVGLHKVKIGCHTQDGDYHLYEFAINVGTNNYYFVGPTAAGLGEIAL